MKSTVYLSFQLNIECPACKKTFDISDNDLYYEYTIIKKIFTNKWDEVEGEQIDCPYCEYQFEADGVEY